MLHKLMITLLASLLAMPAWAACREAQVPYLPNPDMADMGEMLEAQAAVKNYIQRQQLFLDCRRDLIKSPVVLRLSSNLRICLRSWH